jgi:hypothetical protein
VEKKLDAAKDHALSQTQSIDELFNTIDSVKEQARSVRLELDKLVKERKKAIRHEIAVSGTTAISQHIDAINKRLKQVKFPGVKTDFPAVMKGKRTVESLRNAVDTEVARLKIDINQLADQIQVNLNTFDEMAKDYQFLFNDFQEIIDKPNEDFINTIKLRIQEYKAAEEKRLTEQRERIRIEEERKAAAKVQAEGAEKARQQSITPNQDAVDSTSIVDVTSKSYTPGVLVKPTDEQIIEVLALYYRVREQTIIKWLLDMDLSAVSKKIGV